MAQTQVGQARYRRWEPLLAGLLVALKLLVLGGAWGRHQGFDAPHWLDVFRLTHWFEPLPQPRALFGSYHPPLSYLLGRLVYTIVPHEVQASQVLSTLALLSAFFALRSLLSRIGWLGTVAGLWLLYGGFSIPLLVWLAIETGYDALVFNWFMVAFSLSVVLFWQPTPDKWWKHVRFSRNVMLLGLIFAAGILTKFNSLIALALPFLIVITRRGLRAVWRELWAPTTAAIVGVVIVMPLYVHRYFNTEGHWVPISIDWQRPLDLTAARVKRDEAPLRFAANMLRLPTQSITESQYPVVDSFIHTVWLHTWKRDGCLGIQPEPSLSVSNLYVQVFPVILLGGTAVFVLRRRQIPQDWRHLGWVILLVTLAFCSSALVFAWRYPIWDWRVFKAKYITPAVFWVAYATGVAFSDDYFNKRRGHWQKWAEACALVALIAFMVVNHCLPVY